MRKKILFDIGHPAHVHYFRNIINKMESKGISVYVIARDKEVTLSLLNFYNIEYVNRGKGGIGFFDRLIYWFKVVFLTYRYAMEIKPDLIVSFGGTYISHASKLAGIPHICFTDTESARFAILALLPFTEILVTPKYFNKSYGKKHMRFDGLFELAYLNPKYFKPNKDIFNLLNISDEKPYAVIRFVSWTATHDSGEQGISNSIKSELIQELSKYAKIFISHEGKLDDELSSYSINIAPEKMHDVLASASLYLGESPTMTTESALLGTPSICISSWAYDCGNFQLLNKYKLIHCYKPKNQNQAIKKALNIIKNKKSKQLWLNRRDRLLNDMVDVNQYMLSVIHKV